MTNANYNLASSNSEGLLGVVRSHLQNILKTSVGRLIKNSMYLREWQTSEKCRLVMKTYFPQFNYFPLVWMCYSRKLNSKPNRLQERALRIVYNDKSSTFYQLLEKDKSVTIYTGNLQYLATEILKLKLVYRLLL